MKVKAIKETNTFSVSPQYTHPYICLHVNILEQKYHKEADLYDMNALF
jgi:hypothetical protein